jgi:2-haloalkanoic acid dehalogenase type II
MTRKYDAVIFDLLTALLNSWKLWNRVAGSDEHGLRWRRAYLTATYQCGSYRPYEYLIRDAADAAGLPLEKADQLIARWGELEPWNEVGDVVGALARRVPLGIATNSSNALAEIAVAAVGVKFSAVVTAESAGYYKPRPEPYLAVLEKLGVAPERALFVAGSAADVPGATNAGMGVFWHNRAGLAFTAERARPAVVSNTLTPLLELV